MSEPTAKQAAHVLYAFGSGGFRAGDFTICLIEAIQRADPENQAKLAQGFPGYVTAVRWAMNDLDGIDKLRAVAGTLAGRS